MVNSLRDLSQSELKAYRYIRNELVHYNDPPSVRDVMRQLDLNSPRSAELVINNLIKKDLLQRRADSKLQLVKDLLGPQRYVNTVRLSLVGNVAAGRPILAEENIQAKVSVDERLLSGDPRKYFLLKVQGDSMDRAGIKNGDLALVRQQATAEPGDKIVALIDGEATIKEFAPAKDKVVLRPNSSDASIQPIILREDFLIQGVVKNTISQSALGV